MRTFLVMTVLLLVGGPTVNAQTYQGETLVKATLVSSSSAIVPGVPFQVGLLLEMAPHWHTYWQYPGDAGEATSLKWELPEGFTVGEIEWPLPEAVMLPGDILDYAYENRVLLMATITPPENLPPTAVTLKATAKWLVCEEICVPGRQDVAITLPVSDSASPANEALFSEFRKQLPRTSPPFEVQWEKNERGYAILLSGIGDAKEVQFFPLPDEQAVLQHPVVTMGAGSATVDIPMQGSLKGGVIALDGKTGYAVQPPATATGDGRMSAAAHPSSVHLWEALLYGMIGGLILNLMPCVLPVISLKIFGFVKQAGEERSRIFLHGLAFVGGVFLWFLGLGIVICLLKNAGNQVTWAFQFQNPYFNLVIGVIVFVFALNFFGVYEITLPGFAGEGAASLASREGYAGSFFQGVFATLLATPCTAPFLGTALGFAFSQSNFVIMAMFASIATGMGLPYLILSAWPGWMRFLPRPGTWMERLKQFMGFPLIATLLWLLYIIGQQRGIDALIWTSCFLLLLGVACWIYGAFATPLNSVKSRAVSSLLILVIVGVGAWYCIGIQFRQSVPIGKSISAQDGIAWVPFSTASLRQYIAERKPVFVDFTADWCVTCKFNEKTAINTAAVREAFQKGGIIAMKADWTNSDPEITEALAKFGQVGVPFYLFYPAGKEDAPVILPTLLTEKIVLDAIR